MNKIIVGYDDARAWFVAFQCWPAKLAMTENKSEAGVWSETDAAAVCNWFNGQKSVWKFMLVDTNRQVSRVRAPRAGQAFDFAPEPTAQDFIP